MAGIYEGLEELAFKRTARGYVFQTANPWLFGPASRYFVTETQKMEIAACIRETLRRVKPFVFGYAVLLPFLFAAAMIWLAFSGCTLAVTVKDGAGESTTSMQSIGLAGAKGVLAGPAGSTIAYSVDGPPGYGDKLTITTTTAAGKVGAPLVVAFVDGVGTTVNMLDTDGHVARTAILVGRADLKAGMIMFYLAPLLAALFIPLFVLPHAYRVRRLRPLVVGLPRTEERIAWRENFEALAVNASPRLLLLFFISGAIGFTVNAANLIYALLHDRAPNLTVVLWGLGTSTLLIGYFVCLTIRRRKHRRAVHSDRAPAR